MKYLRKYSAKRVRENLQVIIEINLSQEVTPFEIQQVIRIWHTLRHPQGL